MKVINFGSINIDHVYGVDHFVRPGETMTCEALRTFAGGKGYNQTTALARGGAAVAHVGMIGADGAWLRDALAADGADVENLSVAENVPTGHAIIQVDKDGRNCIIINGGANVAATPAFVCAALEGANAGDFFLTQNETSSIAEAMRAAHARGLRIVFNPAPMNARVLSLPLELVEFFVVNEIEGAELCGDTGAWQSPGSAGLEDSATRTDYANVLNALCVRFPRAKIIMTLGAEGAVFADAAGGERVTVPAFRVSAVDTTAAGDTFIGYFLAGLTRGDAMAVSLKMANAAAALSVTRAGAAPSIPTRDEVRTWLAARDETQGETK